MCTGLEIGNFNNATNDAYSFFLGVKQHFMIAVLFYIIFSHFISQLC